MTEVLERTKRGVVRVDRTDWANLSERDSLAMLNLQGYTVLPALLSAEEYQAIDDELADLPMDTAPYSVEQKFAKTPPQWHSKKFAEVIGHPRLTAFLKKALGEDIIFMLGHYVKTGIGVPGLSLHSDYQPYGSPQKGWEESSPATVRVLIYSTELTVDKSAFTIMPKSHLSISQDANPYLRYDNHPDMVTLAPQVGDAIIFNVKAFHGTHPYESDVPRTMLEYAYRPAWARCAGPVMEWDAKDVENAPDIAKPYLKPRNSGEAESLLGTKYDAEQASYPGLCPVG